MTFQFFMAVSVLTISGMCHCIILQVKQHAAHITSDDPQRVQHVPKRFHFELLMLSSTENVLIKIMIKH
jgi:hypothetical protein